MTTAALQARKRWIQSARIRTCAGRVNQKTCRMNFFSHLLRHDRNSAARPAEGFSMAPARPRHARYRRIGIDIDTTARNASRRSYTAAARDRGAKRASCGNNKCCGT
jgi:hypothetical protein